MKDASEKEWERPFVVCSRCGEVFPAEEMQRVNGFASPMKILCENCLGDWLDERLVGDPYSR